MEKETLLTAFLYRGEDTTSKCASSLEVFISPHHMLHTYSHQQAIPHNCIKTLMFQLNIFKKKEWETHWPVWHVTRVESWFCASLQFPAIRLWLGWLEVANHLSLQCSGLLCPWGQSWFPVAFIMRNLSLDVSCFQSCHSTAEPVTRSLDMHLEAWLPFIQGVLSHKNVRKNYRKFLHRFCSLPRFLFKEHTPRLFMINADLLPMDHSVG